MEENRRQLIHDVRPVRQRPAPDVRIVAQNPTPYGREYREYQPASGYRPTLSKYAPVVQSDPLISTGQLRPQAAAVKDRVKPLRKVAYGVVLSLAAGVVLVFSSGLLAQKQTPVNHTISAELTASKKLFKADEKPTFNLKLKNDSTVLGDWLNMRAYAAEAPDVKVTNQGRLVDVDANISPSGSGYTITLNPEGSIRPGSYQITVQGNATTGNFVQTQTFAWGVLAINSNKAVYLPGETAHLQMGVLSTQGHTICNAPIMLSITDPAGNTRSVNHTSSSKCNGDSLNSEPDYSADYVTGAPGTYTMTMRMSDTDYTASDTFQVKAVPFDIETSSLTRLNPSYAYGMSYHVKPYQNFTGTVSEVLPDKGFKVLDKGGATVTPGKDDVTLVWHVDWRAGQDYELGFQYKIPPVSPAFYYLGKLTLTNKAGKQVYQDQRSWQLAGDAAITFVKETDVTAGTVNSFTASVTSTSGDLLVLLFVDRSSNSSHCLASVSDSAGNSWVVPSANPSQNPPQNSTTGAQTVNAMAYAANAAAITSITVAQCSTYTQDFGFNILEFSGIDTTNPVYGSMSGVYTVATTDVTTGPITLALCDQPTTDMLLRGGDYFCQDNSAVAVALYFAGSANSTLISPGYTALPDVVPTSGSGVTGRVAYQIISTSGPTSAEWTLNSSKEAAWGMMVFRVGATGSWEQSFFWAK